jgi:hypothetical protein
MVVPPPVLFLPLAPIGVAYQKEHLAADQRVYFRSIHPQQPGDDQILPLLKPQRGIALGDKSLQKWTNLEALSPKHIAPVLHYTIPPSATSMVPDYAQSAN